MIQLSDIAAARTRIQNVLPRTPMPHSMIFSEMYGCEVYVKLENLQRTGSFKERGALNKLLSLSAEEKAKGIITASAGNHAQGVAYHGRRLGIQTLIVMPVTSPLIKIQSTRAFGAEVILQGDNYDEAYAHACELQKKQGYTFVHPFNDDHVIAGQGTIGLEILDDVPDIDAVICAIGGGGLIAGIGCAIKTVRPNVQIIGVNAQAVAGMKTSIEQQEIITMPAARTIADGIAVRQVGDVTFEMARRYVDRIEVVSEEEIASAILLMIEREKLVTEGAGAAPLAALMNRDLNLKGKKVALVICGGNINVNLIARIIDRGLVQDGRRVRLRIVLPDRPGMLAKLLLHVGQCEANVLEVSHQRALSSLSLSDTEISLMLETSGQEHVAELMRSLDSKGYVMERIDL